LLGTSNIVLKYASADLSKLTAYMADEEATKMLEDH
jgi:hypothetical protein